MDIENVQNILLRIEVYNDQIIEEQADFLKSQENSKILAKLFNEYTRKKTKAVNDLRIKTEELNKLTAKLERLEKMGLKPSKRMVKEEESLIDEINQLNKEIENYKIEREEAREKGNESLFKINNEQEKELNKNIEEVEEQIAKEKESLVEIYKESIKEIDENRALKEEIEEMKKEHNNLFEKLSINFNVYVEEINNNIDKYNKIKEMIEKSNILNSKEILESDMHKDVDNDKDIDLSEAKPIKKVKEEHNEVKKATDVKEDMYTFDDENDVMKFLESTDEAVEIEEDKVEETEDLDAKKTKKDKKDKKTKKSKKSKKKQKTSAAEEVSEEDLEDTLEDDTLTQEDIDNMSNEELYEVNREEYNKRMANLVEQLKAEEPYEHVSKKTDGKRIFTDESRIDEQHSWMNVANARNTKNFKVETLLDNEIEEVDENSQEKNVSNLIGQVSPQTNRGLVGETNYNQLINQQSQAAFSAYDENDLEDLTDEELEQMALKATNPEDIPKAINDKDMKNIEKNLEKEVDNIVNDAVKAEDESEMVEIDKKAFALAGGKGISASLNAMFGKIKDVKKMSVEFSSKILEKIRNIKVNPGTIKELDSEELNKGRGR